jgi:hypothetical protein
MSASPDGAARCCGEYSLHHVYLGADSARFLSDWKSFLSRSGSNLPMHDPEWLKAHFATQIDDLSVYLLYKSGAVCGIAPFARGEWPLKWQLGEVTLAELPLKRMRVVGGAPKFPDDDRAWDLLFRELALSGNALDAVYLDRVPVDSFLWGYLRSSALLRGYFRRYVPQAPSTFYTLHLRGSFDAYMGRFSSKHRNTLLRRVRRLKDGVLGQMRFIRYTRPEDVSEFVDLAVAVSRKTWQWNLLTEGIRDDDAYRRLLGDLAGRGWLRSYILVCGESPVAYVIGFQYCDRFIFHAPGFDPDCSKYSVGTVLFVLMIEDLFVHQKAEVIDLGGDGTYKEAFTNESVLEGSVFLFRRAVYTRFVQAGHELCQFGSRTGSAVLDKLKLKEKVRKRIREASLPS